MPKVIKNLSQLKRALVKGAEFTIVNHCRPELIGERRQINVVNTAGFYSIVPDQPENKATLANRGKGSWLGWSKAPFWSFDGATCVIYDSDSNHSDQSLIVAFQVEDV